MTTITPEALMPRLRWNWLWGKRADLLWTFAPFWAGLALVLVLLAARNLGGVSDNPVWNFRLWGKQVHLAAFVMYFYGPLIDAPHLWATIARTYTDREEWAQRRGLFLTSLGWFAVGPLVILLPYVIQAAFHLSTGFENVGWVAWSHFFTFYALFHINKQHWGFVSLYKRKNADSAEPLENRADSLFFHTTIWLPYVAMLSAPWYVNFDGRPIAFFAQPILGTTLGGLLNSACHITFFGSCIAYASFQLAQWRSGVARNGPKLAYMATILPLYYLAFAVHPLAAAFWVLVTGVGHCTQYHRIVWAYGQTKYVSKADSTRSLPSRIFGSVWLYVGLGLVFGIVTLQGPGAPLVQRAGAQLLESNVLTRAFTFSNKQGAFELGIRLMAAFISGVRLHHFYVDSKIWRVSKSPQLAQNLKVS